ncbi:MAG: hypothetical protein ACRDF8_03460 [Chloroflexota bacterium]
MDSQEAVILEHQAALEQVGANSSRRSIAVALDQPAVVVAILEGQQGGA